MATYHRKHEKFTSISVSDAAVQHFNKLKKKHGLSADNMFRKLMGMSLVERKMGRPTKKKAAKKKKAKKS